MLVCQHTDDPAVTEEGRGSLHLLLAVERQDTAASAVAVDKVVHTAAPEGLVDASGPARLHEFGDLGIDFPVTEVAQGGNRSPAACPAAPDPVVPICLISKRDPAPEGLAAEGGDLDRGDHVRPEVDEMPPGQPGEFTVGGLRSQGNAEIAFGEGPVAGQNHPCRKARQTSQQEAGNEGQETDERDQAQGQQVNHTIHEHERRRQR